MTHPSGKKLGAYFAAVAVSLALGATLLGVPGATQAQAPAPGAARPAAAGPPLPQKGETAGHYYKNVRILKDLPADELVPAMQFMSNSLNVLCVYCHVQGAFEKEDKKPYATSRKMMLMVQEINRTNFDRETRVTCYTCHRFSTVPASAAPVLEPGKMLPPPVAASPNEPQPAAGAAKSTEALPSADQIVDKYLLAISGTSSLDALQTRVSKGTVESGGAREDFDQQYEAPNKSFIIRRGARGSSGQGYDGAVAWLQRSGGPARELVGLETVPVRRASEFARTLALKKSYKAFHDVSKTKVDDHDAYLVLADGVDTWGTDQLYFDAASGLLVRVVQSVPTLYGNMLTQYDYNDYRDAGGVKVPFEMRVATPDALSTFHFTEIHFNTPVEQSKFAKP